MMHKWGEGERTVSVGERERELYKGGEGERAV